MPVHWYAVSIPDDGEDREKLGVEILKKLKLTIDDDAEIFCLNGAKRTPSSNRMFRGKQITITVDKG